MDGISLDASTGSRILAFNCMFWLQILEARVLRDRHTFSDYNLCLGYNLSRETGKPGPEWMDLALMRPLAIEYLHLTACFGFKSGSLRCPGADTHSAITIVGSVTISPEIE